MAAVLMLVGCAPVTVGRQGVAPGRVRGTARGAGGGGCCHSSPRVRPVVCAWSRAARGKASWEAAPAGLAAPRLAVLGWEPGAAGGAWRARPIPCAGAPTGGWCARRRPVTWGRVPPQSGGAAGAPRARMAGGGGPARATALPNTAPFVTPAGVAPLPPAASRRTASTSPPSPPAPSPPPFPDSLYFFAFFPAPAPADGVLPSHAMMRRRSSTRCSTFSSLITAFFR